MAREIFPNIMPMTREMRRIHLLTHWEKVDPGRLRNSTAVVIDVLLATTNIAVGLQHGAERFVLARDREETDRLAGQLPPGDSLRAGEVGDDIIREYELSPLPSSFRDTRIRGKTIVMNTTNGTKAVHACRSAEKTVLAAVVNAGAVVNYLFRESVNKITIVCAGNIGRIAYEDFFCGGLMVDRLVEQEKYRINDAALAARDAYLQRKDDPLPVFRESLSGRAIRAYGSEEEIRLAAKKDVFPIIPSVTNHSTFIEVRGARQKEYI